MHGVDSRHMHATKRGSKSNEHMLRRNAYQKLRSRFVTEVQTFCSCLLSIDSQGQCDFINIAFLSARVPVPVQSLSLSPVSVPVPVPVPGKLCVACRERQAVCGVGLEGPSCVWRGRGKLGVGQGLKFIIDH